MIGVDVAVILKITNKVILKHSPLFPVITVIKIISLVNNVQLEAHGSSLSSIIAGVTGSCAHRLKCYRKTTDVMTNSSLTHG